MPQLLFPEWAPDQSPIAGVAAVISGCFPKKDGYEPAKVAQAFSSAMGERCRGVKFARKSDGSVQIFAGGATRLYLLNNTDNTWEDVSQGGSSNSTNW
jgi:hypothetical protein